MEECCGTCRYHQWDGSDWVCVNNESEYVADYTGYEDSCSEWEERKKRK